MAQAIHIAQNPLVIEREFTLADRSTMEIGKALGRVFSPLYLPVCCEEDSPRPPTPPTPPWQGGTLETRGENPVLVPAIYRGI